ncbi:iron reductase domain protein [Cucurbitaria berberidis CBS 394.84]|uniref:Iron reductase domain protein n=1 Tax=Cucurbitaria berberidis CBS 394.84 TaxID=1168544 RepID=A0A9P4GR08_9PLEO|nr:iron reductase domain protein [Cucurbitaria berberidis CBS 394.84]KAF1849745.1 iron reductase domain protein [Cucurbitaria berberidis CBS 394.84]
MRPSKLLSSLATISSTVSAQTLKRYCDATTSICFSGWTGTNGITFGIALPEAKAAPFDTVLQIVSPIKNGWVGFSWGGTMPYVPLTIGWVNNASNTAIYSSRMAYGLSLPQPYDGTEYSYLRGTGYNATHWTLNVRCKGCSQWHDVDGNLSSINPTATAQKFAYALASKLPAQPANNRSTFNVHNSFGNYKVNLTQGQNTNFDQLVAANLIKDAPPTSSSASVPSSTISARPTSLSTSILSSATPGPTQTGVPRSCANVAPLHFPVNTAKGWRAVKVAGGLTQPRGLLFDTAGNLLVVQNGLGITAHKIDPNGCFASSKTILTHRNLNHGIVLSQDGKTLYASSATSAFAWAYDAATMSVSGNSTTIVSGMDARGHVTRTLVIPPKHPHLLLVSHGSNDNFDYGSADIKTGRSCVKVFDTTATPADGYRYATGGYQMGYGLRNEVGLAFDEDGMLWGVENSSDEITRTINGVSIDIHTDNPADEINYLGDPAKENTQWYGYPTCYTLAKPEAITDRRFAVGDQFVLEPNTTFTDDTCKSRSVAAKLALPAHSAPLDATFNKNFTSLYITIHGSWNRNPSTGYKVIDVPFAKGANGFGPKASLNSTTGWTDIFWNDNVEQCSTTQCFRPVSIATDKFGRMYITSDSGAEGEMIILGRE